MAEQPVNKGSAADRIDPRGELALLEHAHHLEPLDGGVGRFNRLEADRRPAQSLDRAVVGLDAVVEVFRLTVLDDLDIRIIPLHLPQRFAVGRVLVGVDHLRDPVWLRFRATVRKCLATLALHRSAR
jgi:hypothetical protein